MIDKLELPMMVRDNQASLGTAFTVSIEARHGVTTGISARDRATTIRAAIADDTGPSKIVSPGHIFPLRAREGGVLVRRPELEEFGKKHNLLLLSVADMISYRLLRERIVQQKAVGSMRP